MTPAPSLKDFATTRQGEILAAIEQHGSHRATAKAMGLSAGTIGNTVQAVKRKAALQGFAPEADLTHVVPSPHVLRGVSSLYDGDGKLRLQWVKTKLDETKFFEVLKECVEWLVRDAEGIFKPVPPPQYTSDEFLAAYPMGDPHFGMRSWAPETGADFDLDIAERNVYAGIDRLVAVAPDCDDALIPEMGDFFHADNNSNMTPRSGHVLDVDTRWQRVMQIGFRAMCYVITATLRKHKRVTVRIVKGNHDPHSSFGLALALSAFFRNEPRVYIDLSPRVYWYFNFGRNLIGITHGDGCKQERLPGIMAADVPELWGQTKYREFYRGHLHHDEEQEYPGCKVRTFRTLAAPDSYSAGAGYRSGRDTKLLVYHRDYGLRETHHCNIDMIEAARAA